MLFFMVALHIGAILIYKYVKKQNLTMAMLHGRAAHDVRQHRQKMAVFLPCVRCVGWCYWLGACWPPMP